MSIPALVAAAAVAAGSYAFYSFRKAEAPAGQPPFASFGFRRLKLARAQMVNHDVKRLRFDLGDPTLKSGLSLTSSLLAISFPGGGWLPVLRPYTPVNDLGKSLSFRSRPGAATSCGPKHAFGPGEASAMGMTGGGACSMSTGAAGNPAESREGSPRGGGDLRQGSRGSCGRC